MKPVLAWMLGLVLWVGPASASAQNLSIKAPIARFKPAAAAINYYVTERGQTLPHLKPSAGLLFSYAHRPLELVNIYTDEAVNKVVEYQVNLDLMLALGIWDRFEIGVALPVTLAQGSEDLATLRGDPGASLAAGIGDIRLVPKVRIWTKSFFTVAATLPVSFPTGSRDNFLGEDGVTFAPRVVADFDFGRFGAGINAGYLLRKDQSFRVSSSQPQVTVDDEFFASVGARVGLWQERIDLVLDGYMAMSVDEQDKEEIPVELLGGLRFFLPLGFIANVGAGPGLNRGIGTPVFRVFAGVSYVPAKSEPKDTDGDGLTDDKDTCPTRPEDKDDFEDTDGCPDPDNDKDGILDADDGCKNDPEDKDSFEDEDGCPDPDNDKDGLKDAEDKCPNDAEDKDSFEDEDGCPDPDNDKDGILDADDKCPLKAEDKDGWQDDDGCPEADNDQDGVLDAQDKCPTEPETFNGVDDEDGCPDKSKGPVQISRGKITVPPVYFATAKDVILRRSFKTLEQVADTLQKNAWIKKVRIEGHTDNRGKDEMNMDLSKRRAASVMRFLVEKGIDAGRLESQGYGETRPIASNITRRGRAENRRVEFVIVDPPMKTSDEGQAKPAQ